MPAQNAKRPELRTEQMVEMYLSGMTMTQIGLKLGIFKTSVKKRLVKAGVQLRKNADYVGKERFWSWKGERTEMDLKRGNPKHLKWSRAVRQRDNFKCQDCGLKGIRLHAHHLVSLKECINTKLEYDVDNGITVCVPCHGRRHKEMNKGKSTT